MTSVLFERWHAPHGNAEFSKRPLGWVFLRGFGLLIFLPAAVGKLMLKWTALVLVWGENKDDFQWPLAKPKCSWRGLGYLVKMVSYRNEIFWSSSWVFGHLAISHFKQSELVPSWWLSKLMFFARTQASPRMDSITFKYIHCFTTWKDSHAKILCLKSVDTPWSMPIHV